MFFKRTIIFVIAISLLVPLLSVEECSAENQIKRLYGWDRYETAAAISRDGWQQSEYAVVAYGEDFPDAIISAPLAKKYDAPILLTGRGSLNGSTRKELLRLKASHVFIVGGLSAVSQYVESEIKQLGMDTERLAGADRYETAVRVAERLRNFNEIVITCGESFQDALTMAPVAAKRGIPILLVEPDSIPDCVRDYLKDKQFSNVYLADSGRTFTDRMVMEIPRPQWNISGNDSYETNNYAWYHFRDDLDSGMYYLSSGEEYEYALSAAALAAKNSAPIIFVNNSRSQAAEIYNFIRNSTVKMKTPAALGGYQSVSENAVFDFNNNPRMLDLIYAVPGCFGNPHISQLLYDGDWVYYIREGYYSDAVIWGEVAIYKIKRDGTENTRVYAIGNDPLKYDFSYLMSHQTNFIIPSVTNLRIQGDSIYYSVIFDGITKHFRVRKDGSRNQEID